MWRPRDWRGHDLELLRDLASWSKDLGRVGEEI